RVAKDAFEFHADPPAQIGLWNEKLSTVPSDAGFREVAAERLVTVAVAGALVEGQLDRPIVWQVELAPSAVVEIPGGGPVGVARLGQIRKIARGVTEVLGGVVRVAERKAPAGVEREAFANC